MQCHSLGRMFLVRKIRGMVLYCANWVVGAKSYYGSAIPGIVYSPGLRYGLIYGAPRRMTSSLPGLWALAGRVVVVGLLEDV